jgi:hypothetical protein
VLTPNILARKLEEGPLPYCKTGAESEGFNWLGPFASVKTTIKQNALYHYSAHISVYESSSQTPVFRKLLITHEFIFYALAMF